MSRLSQEQRIIESVRKVRAESAESQSQRKRGRSVKKEARVEKQDGEHIFFPVDITCADQAEFDNVIDAIDYRQHGGHALRSALKVYVNVGAYTHELAVEEVKDILRDFSPSIAVESITVEPGYANSAVCTVVGDTEKEADELVALVKDDIKSFDKVADKYGHTATDKTTVVLVFDSAGSEEDMSDRVEMLAREAGFEVDSSFGPPLSVESVRTGVNEIDTTPGEQGEYAATLDTVTKLKDDGTALYGIAHAAVYGNQENVLDAAVDRVSKFLKSRVKEDAPAEDIAAALVVILDDITSED